MGRIAVGLLPHDVHTCTPSSLLFHGPRTLPATGDWVSRELALQPAPECTQRYPSGTAGTLTVTLAATQALAALRAAVTTEVGPSAASMQGRR